MRLVTASEMQEMDQTTIEALKIPGRVLMENAGRGAVGIFLEKMYRKGSVGVIAGRGNNGGDGFVMARYLAQKQIPVTVFLLAPRSKVTSDAKANLDLLYQLSVPVIEIPDTDTFSDKKLQMRHHHYWIDAILGTGLKSDVKGYFKEVITFINQMGKPVFSVDIPSGLDSETGQIRGSAVHANETATFAFAKPGHCLFPGAEITGGLHVVEIGIPPLIAEKVGSACRLITPNHIKSRMPDRRPDAHKGSTGHLVVVAGSTGKTGAAAMTAASALRAGAGLVTMAVPKSINSIVESLVVEAMTAPLPDDSKGMLDASAMDKIMDLTAGKNVVAMGPGMGTAEGTRRLVHDMISSISIPLVIDADGLNNIAGDLKILQTAKYPVVLTPHPGEMARLSGESILSIQKNRILSARSFAEKYRVHLVLKGARTVIAHPDGTVFINLTGNPGMASGGMGDVLTGLVAGYMAQGIDVKDACHTAVFLHGAAADFLSQTKGKNGFFATEVMDQIPRQVEMLRMGKEDNLSIYHDPLSYDTDQ